MLEKEWVNTSSSSVYTAKPKAHHIWGKKSAVQELLCATDREQSHIWKLEKKRERGKGPTVTGISTSTIATLLSPTPMGALHSVCTYFCNSFSGNPIPIYTTRLKKTHICGLLEVGTHHMLDTSGQDLFAYY